MLPIDRIDKGYLYYDNNYKTMYLIKYIAKNI